MSDLPLDMAPKYNDLIASAFDASRLIAIHDVYFKWADDSQLQDAKSILHFFENEPAGQIYDLCFDSALKPLTTIPLPEFPPLLPFIASPNSPNFPRQVLGAHILLDQAPRLLFSGVNNRWTFGFFQDLTMKLAQELSKLSEHQQPQRSSRWQTLGYNFEGAWMRAFLMSTAYVHSEDLQDQLFGQRMCEQERKIAEDHYGVEDPTRALDEEDKSDLGLFPRLVGELSGGKDVQCTSKADAIWKLCRIVRGHESIIRTFGRYPYRNAAMGRTNTKEEAEFIALISGAWVGEDESARTIREDVKAGIIRPLQAVKRPGSE